VDVKVSGARRKLKLSLMEVRLTMEEEVERGFQNQKKGE
jgi:hypothetical protein